MKDENYVVTAYNARRDDKNKARASKVLKRFNKEQVKSIALTTAMYNVFDRAFDRIVGKIESATSAIRSFVGSFTVEPMKEGLREYETMLTSIRTMTTNAEQWYTNITDEAERYAAAENDVSASLDNLNNFADKTIYKFQDMTRAAQRFITQGLTVQDAEAMARGIATLTAYLGGGTEAYSTAVTAYSGSMAQGRMYAMYYNELAAANLVGERWKELLIDSAKILSKDVPDSFSDAYNPDEGEGFKATVNDWVDSAVLLMAFGKIMGGTYQTVDELRSSIMELNSDEMRIDASLLTDEFLEGLMHIRDQAFSAATQVKTLAEFSSALNESIGTGWTKIWQAFFGGYNEAVSMWTGLLEAITDADYGLQHGGNIGTAIDSLIESVESDFAGKGGQLYIQEILFNTWEIIRNIGRAILEVVKIFTGGNSPGDVLLRMAKGLAKITGFIADITSFTTKAFSAIRKLLYPVSTFLGVVATSLGKIVGFLGAIGSHVGNTIYKNLDKIFDSIKYFIRTAGAKFSGFFKDTYEKISTTDAFKRFRVGVESIVDKIKEFFKTIYDYFSEKSINPLTIGGFLSDLWKSISNGFTIFLSMIIKVGNSVKNGFITFSSELYGWLQDSGIVDLFIGIWHTIAEAFKGAYTAFKSVLSIGGSFFEAIAAAEKKFFGAFKNLGFDELFGWIHDLVERIVNYTKNDLSLADAIKLFLSTIIKISTAKTVVNSLAKMAATLTSISASMGKILIATFGMLLMISVLSSFSSDELDRAISAFSKIAWAMSGVLLSMAVMGIFGNRLAAPMVSLALSIAMIVGAIAMVEKAVGDGKSVESVYKILDIILKLVVALSMTAVAITALVTITRTIRGVTKTVIDEQRKFVATFKIKGLSSIGFGVVLAGLAALLKEISDYVEVFEKSDPKRVRHAIASILAVVVSVIAIVAVSVFGLEKWALKTWWKAFAVLPTLLGVAIAIHALGGAISGVLMAMVAVSKLANPDEIKQLGNVVIGVLLAIGVASVGIAVACLKTKHAFGVLLIGVGALLASMYLISKLSDDDWSVAIDRVSGVLWKIGILFAALTMLDGFASWIATAHGVVNGSSVLNSAKAVALLSASMAVLLGTISLIAKLSGDANFENVQTLVAEIGVFILFFGALMIGAGMLLEKADPKLILAFGASISVISLVFAAVIWAVSELAKAALFVAEGWNLTAIIIILFEIVALFIGVATAVAVIASQPSFNSADFANSVKNMALMISMLGAGVTAIVASLALLAWRVEKLDPTQLGLWFSALTAVMIYMIALFGVAMFVTSSEKILSNSYRWSAGLKNISIIIAAISGGLVAIILSMAVLLAAASSTNGMGDVLSVLGVVTTCIGVLLVLLPLLGKINRDFDTYALEGAESVGLIAASITLLILGMSVLAVATKNANIPNMIAGAAIAALLLGAFLGLAALIGTIPEISGKGLLLLVGLSAAFLPFVGIMWLIGLVAPKFVSAINIITTALVRCGNNSGTMLKGTFTLLTSIMYLSAASILALASIPSIFALSGAINNLATSINNIATNSSAFSNNMSSLINALGELPDAVKTGLRAAEEMEAFNIAMNDSFSNQTFISAFDKMSTAVNKYRDALVNLREDLEKTSEKIYGFNSYVIKYAGGYADDKKANNPYYDYKGNTVENRPLHGTDSGQERMVLLLEDGEELAAYIDRKFSERLRR